jgi:hypothetical protein
MCNQDNREFTDFATAADQYADIFLMENINLIEASCGIKREKMNVEDLKKIYIMSEFLYYKKSTFNPIDEKRLYTILQEIGDKEYLKVLRNCCKRGGTLRGSSSSRRVVDYMIEYNLNSLRSNQMVKG